MGKFLVKIPCKPYVRRFLELNFGDPDNLNSGTAIDISKDKALYTELRMKLEKKSYRHDNVYNRLALTRYSDEIAIRITQDDFYRYGWELSKTDIVYMNRLFEAKAKILMYAVVGSHLAMGTSLTDSIDYFQNRFFFPEDVWPKESIYKDCQRNLAIEKNAISQNLSHFIDKITLAKLSENRTILHKTKLKYENNNI